MSLINVGKLFRDHPIFVDDVFLIFASFAVHAAYVFVVDPISAAEIAAALMLGEVPQRTVWLILKDLEQELCLILALWCTLLLLNRYRVLNEDIKLINIDFLGLKKPGATKAEIDERLIEAEQLDLNTYLLPGVRIFLDRYERTESVEDAKSVVFEFYDLREEILDSRLQLVNFVLWAIPSIGFLGTVRGIGQALADADQALSGNIAGVALNLGVAFNSTFVALLLSLILTFLSTSLRGRDYDRLVRSKQFISEALGSYLTRIRVAA
ncbi:MAG: MotA/TolQ/ExbB proton channel family protein [SAR86 cluster bacterium]